MTYSVAWSAKAREDLRRLYAFLLDRDEEAAVHALKALEKSVAFLEQFPFSCRKVRGEDAFLRELVVPFGSSGYVILFRVDDGGKVTIAAVRHQREDDYH